MNDYRAYVENNYNAIYHHGVKGQKWGYRKYQNEDGSLTPEGRQRYLTLNRRGEMRYGVANTAGIGIAGGTATAAAVGGSVASKYLGKFSKDVADTSMSKYYNKRQYNKFKRISRSNFKRSKRLCKLAIVTAGATTVAMIANEMRRKKIMNRLSGMKGSDKTEKD